MLSGLAGGAAGGFVNGATGAWANGASLGEGLMAGVTGAIVGGVTAAFAAGVMYGIPRIGNGTEVAHHAETCTDASQNLIKRSGYIPPATTSANVGSMFGLFASAATIVWEDTSRRYTDLYQSWPYSDNLNDILFGPSYCDQPGVNCMTIPGWMVPGKSVTKGATYLASAEGAALRKVLSEMLSTRSVTVEQVVTIRNRINCVAPTLMKKSPELMEAGVRKIVEDTLR